MTNDNDLFRDDSRRSFIKKGAMASALAVGGAGTATAQETPDDEGGLREDEWGGQALIHQGSYFPNAKFTFESGILQWNPTVPNFVNSDWTAYNTYQIRWLNTNEIVPLYVAEGANVGEYDEDQGFMPDIDDDAPQPQVWEMSDSFSRLEDNEYLLKVNFSPVNEDRAQAILEDDMWWQDLNDGDGENVETATDTPSE